MRFGLGVLVALLLAAPAQAATVSLSERWVPTYKGDGYWESITRVVDTLGERNDVTARKEAGAVIVRDAAAPLRLGAGCTAVDEHTARCVPRPDAGVARVEVHLGDGDDHAAHEDGEGFNFIAAGGAGADVLVGGSSGSDTLGGDEGEDRMLAGAAGSRLDGGAGRDELVGGGGEDVLQGDPPAGPFEPDSMDGGGGEDDVSYESRRVGVRVDLLRAEGQGAPGENDVVRGVENVLGTNALDVLAGDHGPNSLSGAAMAAGEGAGDVLVGRGGDDVLEGGPDRDILDGGDGNDALTGYGAADRFEGGAGDDYLLLGTGFGRGQGDRASCGEGKDRVGNVDLADRVAFDCERGFAWPLYLSPPAAVAGGYVVDVVGTTVRPRCAARVVVVDGRRALASPRFRPPARDVERTVHVRRRVSRPGRLPTAADGLVRVAVQTRCGRRPRVLEATRTITFARS